ncbi:MAG: hypothetical protein NTY46_09490 [Candidatus Sumerlaeota bacterium]|nr:hypothetical protein [Candidatus Sumerlaeota bacterium]
MRRTGRDLGLSPGYIHYLRTRCMMAVFAAALGLHANAADVVVDTSQAWVEGAYVMDNLTVTNGATLTIAGGSTIVCNATLRISGTSQIVTQVKNRYAPVDGQWAGQGARITAQNMIVDPSAALSADTQGYAPGNPAAGPGGATGNSGGTHGGIGGNGAWGWSNTSIYGDAQAPTTPGSGGGSYDALGGGSGGAGGGAIDLTVTGTLTLNGGISANGEDKSGRGAGGGAGGSIYARSGTLTGGGTFSSRGGNSIEYRGGGGGGGRTAVYYINGTGYTGGASSTARAGYGSNSGTAGTIAFFQVTDMAQHLTDPMRQLKIYESFRYESADTSVTLGGMSIGGDGAANARLAIEGGTTITVQGAVSILSTSTLEARCKNTTSTIGGFWAGEGVGLIAQNMTLDATSYITADSQGYTPGNPAAGPGGPTGNSGGTHGGIGAQGGWGSLSTNVYGSSFTPLSPGSGGGGYDALGAGSGGAGGGAIKLTISGTLTLDGLITANGQDKNTGRGDGGGAGGSIYVVANTIAGAGHFETRGGDSLSGRGGGGGGGRIAVYYTNLDSSGGLTASVVRGGTFGNPASQPGTMALYKVANIATHLTEQFRSLRAAGTFPYAAETHQTFNNLTVVDATPQSSNMTFTGATDYLISGNLNLNGASRLSFEGKADFGLSGTLTADGQSLMSLPAGIITVDGDVSVMSTSTLELKNSNTTTLTLEGLWGGTGSVLLAPNISVDAAARISTAGTGYISNCGPGIAGAANGAGAGYGGNGYGNSPPGGTTYGDSPAPAEPGSGGNSGNSPGGSGGGAMRLDVPGTLTLNGIISANGAAGNPAFTASGGGSGGSIYLTAGTLSGAGLLTADGGNGAYGSFSNHGGGGGGGRIAVYYINDAGFNGYVTSSAAGGGGAYPGYPGAVGFFKVTDLARHLTDPSRQLSVYTIFRYEQENTSLTLAKISVGSTSTPQAMLSVAGGSTVNITTDLVISTSSTLEARGKNTTCPVEGGGAGALDWAGAGVTLNVLNASIDATSRISANGYGYAASAGPGIAGVVTGAGAGYGGKGGNGHGNTPPGGPVYGSDFAPVDLGSGGKSGEAGGGSGGGAVRLDVPGTLSLDGMITAAGAAGNPAFTADGGGSGGSIYLTAGVLAGSGILSVNGGNGAYGSFSYHGGGGGGGRIACHYTDATGFTGFPLWTAAGGKIVWPAEDGTIRLYHTEVSDWSIY